MCGVIVKVSSGQTEATEGQLGQARRKHMAKLGKAGMGGKICLLVNVRAHGGFLRSQQTSCVLPFGSQRKAETKANKIWKFFSSLEVLENKEDDLAVDGTKKISSPECPESTLRSIPGR